MDITTKVRSGGGVEIPALGLGVFRTERGGATREAVLSALRVGYRHIDTARIYGNEAEVGWAVRESGLPRGEIFVTTKLWNADQGYDSTRRAFDASLRELGLEYVDLYLMHWPVPEKRLESWRAMEEIAGEGRCRAVGVSNFTARHLDELLEVAKVVPAVNQIELHPFGQQRDVVARCHEAKIIVEAYSPLTRGKRLGDARLVEIAREVSRTPAQVLLRWSLQKGNVVLVKSSSDKRIAENAALFDFALDDAHMTRLDALEEGLHIAWDPTDAP